MRHTPFEISSEFGPCDMNFCSPTPAGVQEWLRDCRATFVMCGHVHCETVRGSLFHGCRVLQSGTAGGVNEIEEPDEALRTYHIVEFGADGKVRIVERSHPPLASRFGVPWQSRQVSAPVVAK